MDHRDSILGALADGHWHTWDYLASAIANRSMGTELSIAEEVAQMVREGLVEEQRNPTKRRTDGRYGGQRIEVVYRMTMLGYRVALAPLGPTAATNRGGG